jgi:hypothetical protein
MKNARTDEFGGNSQSYPDQPINKEKGSSGVCIYEDESTAGAGFYYSPSLHERKKKNVVDVPKCFKDGLRGGVSRHGPNGGFGGDDVTGGSGGYTPLSPFG